MLRADDLVGAWRLEAFEGVDGHGRITDGPLGPGPEGFLLYLPSREMSVSMMRTSPGTPLFMGYAGRWRVRDGQLVHHIIVSSRADWAGTEQTRHIELDGDRLRVSASDAAATAAAAGRAGARPVVRWRRVPTATASSGQGDSTCRS